MREAFPWTRAMAFGLGVLRLAPEQFWRMTPRELAAALDGASRLGGGGWRAPLTRASLNELMTRYPDGGIRQADQQRSHC